ncbi:MAG: HsdR family type I site-specific deoxyribonuclease [Bacteroidales bacterium]|nr:HsdR family type I site-specific deoxyribonuclease [Bacteroidales bacterium]
MAKFTESTYEEAFIELLCKTGWQYTNGEEIHRRAQEVILEDDLRDYLKGKYADLTENELLTLINNIKLGGNSSLFSDSRAMFNLLTGTNPYYLQRDNTELSNLFINYIDFETPKNNIFRCVNQFTVIQHANRRPDILLFVNGIPTVIIELKNPTNEETTIHDAWEQIHNRYTRDIPVLMRHCCLSVIADGANARLGTIFTPYEYYYAWKKIENEDSSAKGIKENETLINGALAPNRFIEILRDYVYYPDNSDDKELEVVCRYPQFFATRKLFDNIRLHLKSAGGDGKGGTYFGATGCGKTFTMLFLARQLAMRDSKTLGNPTIIVITDREDLDTQASKLFCASTTYLNDKTVRSIESRQDLKDELGIRQSGGVFITTIQKFCADTGLLSHRANIVCISDEAHRTQGNTGSKLIIDEEKGVKTSFGFAKYLRDSFPNATYVGFTGTPIDETILVFGDVVDKYTMKESCDDEITVPITYEPRLARVILNTEQSKEIEAYYRQCEEEGSTDEQIERSKHAMSQMRKILAHPERLKKLANDLAVHYEKLVDEKPEIVQKAMIVCADRAIAYALHNEIREIRPAWFEIKKCEDESQLTAEQLEKLQLLPMVNIVATRDKDDPKEMYALLGDKAHRTMLDGQFKEDDSNFKIAIVVDMWITGFDIPSLAVMYIDKPLQRHTLIQTISRVNRKFSGKEKGLIVDYIGIMENMQKALKQYGGDEGGNIENMEATLKIFRNHLDLCHNLFTNNYNENNYCSESEMACGNSRILVAAELSVPSDSFDSSDFFQTDNALARLQCLNRAAEFIMLVKDTQIRYMGITQRLKAAYEICFPSGLLTDKETTYAQFYLAIRSIIYKQTIGHAPDTETMNRRVEEMVRQAITCNGVENIVNATEAEGIFSEEFEKKLDDLKMPMTKFNALLKLLKKAIKDYGRTNKAKAIEFDEMLRQVIEKYNTRDKLTFTNQVVGDFVNSLSDELIDIFSKLDEDKKSFEKLGITFEEKAFYDILVKVRDTHKFTYADEKCILLAKAIKELVENNAEYVDWINRDNIKNQLRLDLTILLYKNGYPPEWNEEVFTQVLEQAEKFKKFSEV